MEYASNAGADRKDYEAGKFAVGHHDNDTVHPASLSLTIPAIQSSAAPNDLNMNKSMPQLVTPESPLRGMRPKRVERKSVRRYKTGNPISFEF